MENYLMLFIGLFLFVGFLCLADLVHWIFTRRDK
jgi:hypothetical protein